LGAARRCGHWVFAVANKIRPDYLGLAAETNLIRQLAPDSVYQALVTMANAVVAQIRAASLPSKLYVSVQVETAWGRADHIKESGRISPTFRSSRRSAYRLRFKCRDQIGT
jgi:hypothetical protein